MTKKTNLTPWFRVGIRPAHEGVYMTRFLENDEVGGYSHWNGQEWGNEWYSVERAHRRRDSHGAQSKQWRGLARKPR
jgi:hypothetical protein